MEEGGGGSLSLSFPLCLSIFSEPGFQVPTINATLADTRAQLLLDKYQTWDRLTTEHGSKMIKGKNDGEPGVCQLG